MAISTNINGVNKNVISPEVNIGGTWKQVNVVSNNIDGVWRESYNRNKYQIKLYRYGELYDTLVCTKGESVKLVSVENVYDDDISHYGWTETYGNDTRDYIPTKTITPTSNMELHAVYNYSISTPQMVTLDCAVGTYDHVVEFDGTMTFNGWEGTSSSTGTSSTTNITLSSSSNIRIAINGTYITGVTIGKTQTGVSRSVSKGDVITITKAGSHVEYPSSGVSVTIGYTATLTFPSAVVTTGYRSVYGKCAVSLYQYGTLYNKIIVNNGDSITLPTLSNVQSTDIEHCGWSTKASSTTIDFACGVELSPSTSISLYAVYSYETDDYQTKSITGTASNPTETVTITYNGDVVLGGVLYYYVTPHNSAPINGTDTVTLATSTSTRPYITHNGTVVTGTLGNITRTAKAGDTFVLAPYYSYTDGGSSTSTADELEYTTLMIRYYNGRKIAYRTTI